MSTSKFQVSLRCPVLPTLSIAYTLREYLPSITHVSDIVGDVVNPLYCHDPLISYRYPDIHAPVQFVPVSVAAVRSKAIVPVFSYVSINGEVNVI